MSRVMWNDGELNTKGTTVHALILMTFHDLEEAQLTGGPDWIKTEVFNIQAKATPALMAAWPKLTDEQRDAANRSMLRNHAGYEFRI